MAKGRKSNNQNKLNAASNQTRSFQKGMMKDVNDSLMPEGTYFNARNAVNNDRDGDQGVLGNEPSNLFCTAAPYTIIGTIHLYDDKWVIYSTDNFASEIGLFDESQCVYRTIVNDKCLQFSLSNLIIGQAKESFDCTWQVYWADGLNPDRTMNIGDIDYLSTTGVYPPIWPGVPYVCVDTPTEPEGTCIECIPRQPLVLDCEKIRLDKLVTMPCIDVSQGAQGGELENGSYQVCIAYVQNDQRVTDYSLPSNVQPLFAHQNVNGSLDIKITNIDQDYDAYELVLIRTVNAQTVAKKMGLYNASQGSFSIDRYNEALTTVPLELLPLQRPSYEKSEGVYRNGEYLIRTAPTTKLDFNYQPLANQIKVKWNSVELPADYYRKGGNLTSYLRDEQYSLFIRWVYNTGDKSSSYHIPGRAAFPFEKSPINDLNSIEVEQGYTPEFWEVYNTARIDSSGINFNDPKYDTKDGNVIAEGDMGYWESTELYPDNKPEVWGNLCGQPIRHHKIPDYCTHTYDGTTVTTSSNEEIAHFKDEVSGNCPIRIIGLRFEDIKAPVKNPNDPPSQQTIIDGIVGYEILRGSREGNKTILAKGIINNLREFELSDKALVDQGVEGLYPNYPYNDLSSDYFFSETKTKSGDTETTKPLKKYKKDIVTFHSPDTTFKKPFLGEDEIKVNMLLKGSVDGNYDFVDGHPQSKILTNFTFLISGVIGLGLAILSIGGKKTGKRTLNKPGNNLWGGESKWKTKARSGGSNINLPAYAWSIVDAQGVGVGGTLPPIPNINTSQGGGSGDNYNQGEVYYMPPEFDSNTNGWGNWVAAYDGAIVSVASGADSNLTVAGLLTGLSNDTLLDGSFTAGNNLLSGVDKRFEVLGEYSIEFDQNSTGLSGAAKVIYQIPMLSYYWNEGTEKALSIIKNLIPYKKYAIAAKSHCYYNKKAADSCGTRRLINNANYLDNHMQDFNTDKNGFNRYKVNNLFRSKSVILQTDGIGESEENGYLPIYLGTDADNSRQRLQDLKLGTGGKKWFKYDEAEDEDGITMNSNWSESKHINSASYYTSIKNRFRNQYGQLDAIIQVPASSCISNFTYTLDPDTFKPLANSSVDSGVIFGGDTYIGRYTEKNTMFFFYDWMMGQPDGFEFNYRLRNMLPYTSYWMDTKDYDVNTFITGLYDAIGGIGTSITSLFGSNPTAPSVGGMLPSSFHNFDRNGGTAGFSFADIFTALASPFYVKNAYMYLFNSGVRDFYVESEINIDLRDWDEVPEKRYYDPYRYTDLNSIFDPQIIKAGNYNKYDYSLSISTLYQEFASWANVQLRDYDPETAERCYTYWPNRLIYSLPQHKESRYDGWTSFLVNNYRDFISRVTDIKPIGLGGAYMLFESQAPAKITAEDAWKYDSKQKLTIGDGGLFSQPLQHVVNADPSFEYGSCQDRLSVINTPGGLFYISQNQGKVFGFTGNLSEISAEGMRWWFERYLPYKIHEDFPDFDLTSNPVIGVGCQSIYDNSNGVAYFCKKDYKLNPKGQGIVRWLNDDNFITDTGLRIKLGDPEYFFDASWTISYDVKAKYWISFHDWYPDLSLHGKNTFMTTKGGGIWTHNVRCDSYGNFYDEQYPFEVDIIIPTGQNVNILKSYQYLLECYIWDDECKDKFHDLDYNFDEAIVYNSEQVSGVLKLNITPKNNVNGILDYPQINTASGFIDILYDKVEQRYRFNQFWDITRDRGEFPIIPGTFSQQPIWDTEYNGYIRNLNNNNLNYTKEQTQRKKFRHYNNMVRLTRRNQTNREMWFKIFNTKELYSPR